MVMRVDAPDALRLHGGHEQSIKAILPRDPRRLLSEGEDPIDEVLPALVHKYTQPIEFIAFFDLKQKNVTR